VLFAHRLNVLLIEFRPHSRKEAKLDTKTKLYQLNELAGKEYFTPKIVPRADCAVDLVEDFHVLERTC
jgi:hypothetical protein